MFTQGIQLWKSLRHELTAIRNMRVWEAKHVKKQKSKYKIEKLAFIKPLIWRFEFGITKMKC